MLGPKPKEWQLSEPNVGKIDSVAPEISQQPCRGPHFPEGRSTNKWIALPDLTAQRGKKRIQLKGKEEDRARKPEQLSQAGGDPTGTLQSAA